MCHSLLTLFAIKSSLSETNLTDTGYIGRTGAHMPEAMVDVDCMLFVEHVKSRSHRVMARIEMRRSFSLCFVLFFLLSCGQD